MVSPLFPVRRSGSSDGLLPAPANIVATPEPSPDGTTWDATFDPVDGADHYEYIVDNSGIWTPVDGSPISNSNLAGFHLLLVRAVSADDVAGNIGVSNQFELTEG